MDRLHYRVLLFGARSPLAPRARFQVRGFLFPHESLIERIYPKPEDPVLTGLISLLRRLLSLLRVRGSGFEVRGSRFVVRGTLNLEPKPLWAAREEICLILVCGTKAVCSERAGVPNLVSGSGFVVRGLRFGERRTSNPNPSG